MAYLFGLVAIVSSVLGLMGFNHKFIIIISLVFAYFYLREVKDV